MEEITKLSQIDYISFFNTLFIIISAITTIVIAIKKFFDIIGKPIKWFNKRNEDHELILKTIDSLGELEKKHNEDVQQSIRHDKLIKENLNEFIQCMKESMFEYQNDIDKFANNRICDREQSLKIQAQLSDSINMLANGAKDRTEQIKTLKEANKEILADRINQKYKHYVNELHGIPSDEVDEFTSLHAAYKSLGGNHHGDAKYNYVMNNLQVIPVEIKLVYDNEDK